MTRPDYAREIRFALTDARELCDRLGMLSDRKGWVRQAGGVIVRCPWHGENRPSCSVRVARDGTIAAKCFSCGATGDALSLIAAVRGLSIKRDFRVLMVEAAELAGLWAVVGELQSGSVNVERPAAPSRPEPEPERTYPSEAEVIRLLVEGEACTDNDHVSSWLSARGLDPVKVDMAGGRALQDRQTLPRWAGYKGRSWVDTGHRMVLPMHDAYGAIRSVRAARVVDGETPKRLPPGGHKASELVLACDLGVAMLRGQFTPERILIVEGEPDFLEALSWQTERPYARIGIVSGSWTWRFAERVPAHAEVHVFTHLDAAGEAYFGQIRQTLSRRGTFLRRWEGKAA